MRISIIYVSTFKKGLDSIVIQKSRSLELITFTEFLNVKMNRNQSSYYFDFQGRRSAKSI